MKKMVKRSLLAFAIIVLCVALVGCGGAKETDKPKGLTSITVATGSPGGSWFPIGAAIAEIFSNNGIKANAEPGGGVSNVVMVSDGKADIGLTNSMIPTEAFQGNKPFEKKYENIAGLAFIFPNFQHVIVSANSGVNDISDLKGKPFADQPVGTATQMGFRDLLSTIGLTESDLKMTYCSQQEGAEMLKDNHVIGMTAFTGPPTGAITELATSKEIKFLDVSDEMMKKLNQKNSGYVRDIMPANTYPKQTKEVKGVGSPTILIVRKDMPDDQAYLITKLLVENIAKLNSAHNSLKSLTAEKMSQVSGLPIHPGAAKYYKEVLKK